MYNTVVLCRCCELDFYLQRFEYSKSQMAHDPIHTMNSIRCLEAEASAIYLELQQICHAKSLLLELSI